jgi:flagellin
MSSGISLTANIRQNLLSLQDTSSLQSTTAKHLSTGKKVSSALDNPVNFFTAQGLNNRSSQLTSLLDGMSNGIQTIQAANKGVTSMTSVIQQMQSLVKTARQDATSTTLGAATTATSLSSTTLDSTKQLSFTLADGSTVGIAVGSGAAGSGTSLSKSAIASSINNNASLSQFVSATIDDAGNLQLKNKTSSAIAFTGITAGAIDGGATVGSLAAGTSAGLSDVRKNAANQFNDLKNQLDTIAKDSGYNGTNLLGGDTLNLVFNEKTGPNASTKNVRANNADGTAFGAVNATSLGLNSAAVTADGTSADWSNNANLDSFSTSLTRSLATLQTQSAQFGTALALTQTRQDFTKQIADVLTTGASALTDADLNEEAANSQALSTRQSIGISALSLANQANQGILQLLR